MKLRYFLVAYSIRVLMINKSNSTFKCACAQSYRQSHCISDFTKSYDTIVCCCCNFWYLLCYKRCPVISLMFFL
ncbi:uncharacterized protein V1510DRAFT_414615 [Dipodascopsis tothii]|uniref:uncharacterized protein n=1 Tax=Dipodascopsis tothii TaxID=44089 RepID=UPI0034CF026F